MRSVLNDLRYSLRVLLRSPGFTIVAVLALALGIGANTAIFSLVNGVLLKALPYEDADRIVVIWETNPELGVERTGPSAPNYLDWKEQNTVFESIALVEPGSGTLVGLGEPEQIAAMRVTPELAGLLGGGMALGRWFNEDEGLEDGVVVLSHDFWQNRLGGDPEIVGRKLKADGRIYEVIGIAATDLWSPIPSECFVPWNEENLQRMDRLGHHYGVLARLRPGVSVEQAEAELSAIQRGIGERYPELRGFGVTVVRLDEALLEGVRQPLLVLIGAVGFVLLIACANVANLLLARMSNRRREVAMRTALGASRFRVARQLLTESVTLSLVGGIAGLLLSLWGVELLRELLPGTIPIPNASAEALLAKVEVDGSVLLFTALVSLATGVLFGLAPVLYLARTDINNSLRASSRSASSGSMEGRIRDGLVVAEIAVALVLLIGAGLMIGTFQNLRQVSTGFRAGGVITLQMELPTDTKYRQAEERQDFLGRVLDEMRAIPGVEAAGLTEVLPLDPRLEYTTFRIEGDPPLPDGVPQLVADYSSVSPDYFEVMGIPIVRGRAFAELDNRDRAPVALISQALAERHFERRDPIGHRLIVEGEPREIVGVVGDIRHAGLDQAPKPTIYLPYFQHAGALLTLVVRTSGDPRSLVRPIQEAVWRVDAEQPLFRIRTMEEVLEEARVTTRLTVILLGAFAGLALVMAAIGVYGVMSFSVRQRRREIGLRMAMGARSADVFRLILGRSAALAGVGILIGLGAGIALSQLLSGLLFGVTATDPPTLAAVAGALLAVALLASYLPAAEASRVDPMVSLRHE